MKIESDLPKSKLEKKNTQIRLMSEDHADTQKEYLSEFLKSHNDSEEKDKYIDLIGDISYEYCRLYQGNPPSNSISDLYGIVNRIMWKDD